MHCLFYRFRYGTLKQLGYDLTAAHFLLYRRGKIRFKDSDNWLDDYDEADLPIKYHPDYHIEALDFSHSFILYEGLENFGMFIYFQAYYIWF